MIILLFLPLFSLNPWYTLYNAVPSHIHNVEDSMGFYIMADFWVRKTTCGQDGGCVGGRESRNGIREEFIRKVTHIYPLLYML